MPRAYYLDQPLKRGRTIRPGDELDLSKAVILAVLKHQISTGHATHWNLKTLRRNEEKRWNEEARQLLRKCNVPERTPYTVQDLTQIASEYPGYKFVLYGRVVPNKIYGIEYTVGPENGILINLMIFQDKYDIFTPSEASIGKTICPYCGKGYTHQYQHRCTEICKRCRFPKGPCETAEPNQSVCPDCNQMFESALCAANHKKSPRGKVSPACDVFKICQECNVFWTPRNGAHICYEQTFCKTCNTKMVVGRHECTWQHTTPEKLLKLQKKEEKFRIIVYDAECIQTRNVGNIAVYGQHFMNMLAYSIFCNLCYTRDVDDPTPCEGCGPNRKGYFYNTDPTRPSLIAEQFVDFLLTNKRLDSALCVAHNGSGYDHHLLIPTIFSLGITPTIIRNGMKLIMMEIPKMRDYPHFNTIRFKDFLLYCPIPLSEASKCFGFENRLAKTHFPFLFNTFENIGKKLNCLPHKKYYGTATMKSNQYADFLTWYRANKNTPFCLDTEVRRYCSNDTAVLHQAIAKYIETSKQLSGFNPLVQTCTYAAFSFFQIRNLHMKKNQVGIIPELGYYTHERQSKLALKMLSWIEHTEKIEIQSHLRDGEYQIRTPDGRRFRVDGYFAPRRQVFEILGCFWHCCPNCVRHDSQHPTTFKLASDVYRETCERLDAIAALGYSMRVYWECSIKAAVDSDPAMKSYFAGVLHTSRLRLREAFSGGKTQNYFLKAEATPERSIQHIDCVSMYPYILMNHPMPEGVPTVITSGLDNITLPLKYKGFYKVVVVPAQVRFPILWMKWNSKLFFATCSKCVKDGAERQMDCKHTQDSERAISISLTHLELEYALQQGSRVLACYEVYHFRRWSTSLFRPFLSKYVALKIQSSGWERPDMSSEEKAKIVEDYRNEGIDIDPAQVEKNPSLRTVAKLAINSAWGKFCERPDKPKTIIFDPEVEFPAILNDPTVKLGGLTMVGRLMMATYTPIEEYVKALKGTNVAISAFCTAIGRIMLNKVLERVGGDRAIYCDTDSCIYYSEGPKSPDLSDILGQKLGQWTSELEDPNWRITRFCSTDNYLKINDATGEQKQVCKVRGIVLDRSARVVNFESMNKLVDQLLQEEPATPLVTKRPQIVKSLGKIETKEMEKKLNPVMNKVLYGLHGTYGAYETRPIGWKVGIDNFFDRDEFLPTPNHPSTGDMPRFDSPEPASTTPAESNGADNQPLSERAGPSRTNRNSDWEELFGELSDSDEESQ